MANRYYDPELKSIAIQRFVNGETSTALAKDLEIKDPDLIRKWVQLWRKKHNLPATDYRKESIGEDIDEILRLRNQIQRLEDDLETSLKALILIAKVKAEDRFEMLSQIKEHIKKRPITEVA
jgi:transposase-like protein